MAPVPTAERPPKGLSAYWVGVWRHALRVLKEQGSWAWEQKPLLDEYVYALRAAEQARTGFAWLEVLERYAGESDDVPDVAWGELARIAGALPVMWDRHTKRAALLADQLLLTPRGRKAAGHVEGGDDGAGDPFDALDELAERRRAG